MTRMSWRMMAGCVAMAALIHPISAAASSAATGMQSRATDDTLRDRIAYRLETSGTVKHYDIKVRVDRGVAVLTGSVATLAQKTEAGRLARVAGVTSVDNNIVVDREIDKTMTERVKGGMSKTGEAITDSWITTKVKWFFLGDDLLKGSSISVETTDHVVTLKGTVRSEAGRARAKQLAIDTEGVKRVVDLLTVSR